MLRLVKLPDLNREVFQVPYMVVKALTVVKAQSLRGKGMINYKRDMYITLSPRFRDLCRREIERLLKPRGQRGPE